MLRLVGVAIGVCCIGLAGGPILSVTGNALATAPSTLLGLAPVRAPFDPNSICKAMPCACSPGGCLIRSGSLQSLKQDSNEEAGCDRSKNTCCPDDGGCLIRKSLELLQESVAQDPWCDQCRVACHGEGSCIAKCDQICDEQAAAAVRVAASMGVTISNEAGCDRSKNTCCPDDGGCLIRKSLKLFHESAVSSLVSAAPIVLSPSSKVRVWPFGSACEDKCNSELRACSVRCGIDESCMDRCDMYMHLCQASCLSATVSAVTPTRSTCADTCHTVARQAKVSVCSPSGGVSGLALKSRALKVRTLACESAVITEENACVAACNFDGGAHKIDIGQSPVGDAWACTFQLNSCCGGDGNNCPSSCKSQYLKCLQSASVF